jgi:DNA mismatch repair protein MutS2
MHASRVLEFDSVLQRLQSHCETRLSAEWALVLQPSFNADEVWHLLAQTDEAHQLLANAPPPSLHPVLDLRDAAKRAGKGGALGGQELAQVGDALSAMRGFKHALESRKEESPLLWNEAQLLPDLRKVEDAIFAALDGSGEVKDSASAHLASLRQRKVSSTSRLQEKIHSYVAGKTRELLSDPIVTMRDGRYVIPVKAEYRGRIKGIVHDTSSSGQTLFVEPEDVLQLGNALREIESAEREEISRILQNLSSRVGAVASEISTGVEAAARLDLVLAKARLGYDLKGTIPEKLREPCIIIEGGRHPLLEPETAVPLDLSLGVGNSVLITGPNTGGKTVAIKSVGLFVLMAQAGLMPPARLVRLGPFTQVWADIGDEQSLQQSLSTFSAHVKNIAQALQGLQAGALVLLDEIGAGTDPAEGAALAKAILNKIVETKGVVLASTHYGELKAFAFETEGFQNAAMEFDGKSLRPTYRLMMGAAGASHALKIAERYGLPSQVVEVAKGNLSTQHQDVTRVFESLDVAQKRARQAQGEADRRLNELRAKEKKVEEALAEAEETRRTAHARAQAAVEDALRELRQQAADVFEQLKSAPVDQKAMELARAKLKTLQTTGQDFAASLRPTQSRVQTSEGLKKGAQVRIEGYNQIGTLLEDPIGKSASVRVGPLKMTVPVERLQATQTKTVERRPPTNVTMQRMQHAAMEIHLRAMRAEEAERELEKFIDDAVLAGLPSVRIVHGKGEGILRKVVQNYLKKNTNVSSFRDGEPGEGGHGVTIAVL